MLASQAVIKSWSEDINGLSIKSTLKVSDNTLDNLSIKAVLSRRKGLLKVLYLFDSNRNRRIYGKEFFGYNSELSSRSPHKESKLYSTLFQM